MLLLPDDVNGHDEESNVHLQHIEMSTQNIH